MSRGRGPSGVEGAGLAVVNRNSVERAVRGSADGAGDVGIRAGERAVVARAGLRHTRLVVRDGRCLVGSSRLTVRDGAAPRQGTRAADSEGCATCVRAPLPGDRAGIGGGLRGGDQRRTARVGSHVADARYVEPVCVRRIPRERGSRRLVDGRRENGESAGRCRRSHRKRADGAIRLASGVLGDGAVVVGGVLDEARDGAGEINTARAAAERGAAGGRHSRAEGVVAASGARGAVAEPAGRGGAVRVRGAVQGGAGLRDVRLDLGGDSGWRRCDGNRRATCRAPSRSGAGESVCTGRGDGAGALAAAACGLRAAPGVRCGATRGSRYAPRERRGGIVRDGCGVCG